MPVRMLARGLRRVVLRFTGFDDVVRRLDELRGQVAAVQPRLDGIEAQVAAVRPSLEEADARFATEAEWARQRHELAVARQEVLLARFDDIGRGLARLGTGEAGFGTRNGLFAATVAAEVDRLDGYLVHHAATLSAGIDALGTGHRTGLAYIAPGLDALVTAGGFDLVVPTSEEGLLAFILRHGLEGVEPGVSALLRSRLKPGAVAVDAGANLGVHSLGMARAVGPEGRVVCFEPLAHLAAAVERSLRLNGFAGRARVERAALADQPGEAVFHRAAHGPMSSLHALPPETASEEVRVPVTTLDAAFPPGSRVDFVKLDVEGAEPRAWRGMARVVAENPGLEIVLEWSASHFRRSGEDPAAFMAAIRAAGFHAFVVEDGVAPGRVTAVGDPAALEGANLLLTRDDAAAA